MEAAHGQVRRAGAPWARRDAVADGESSVQRRSWITADLMPSGSWTWWWGVRACARNPRRQPSGLAASARTPRTGARLLRGSRPTTRRASSQGCGSKPSRAAAERSSDVMAPLTSRPRCSSLASFCCGEVLDGSGRRWDGRRALGRRQAPKLLERAAGILAKTLSAAAKGLGDGVTPLACGALGLPQAVARGEEALLSLRRRIAGRDGTCQTAHRIRERPSGGESPAAPLRGPVTVAGSL